MHAYETRVIDSWDGWEEIAYAAWQASHVPSRNCYMPSQMNAQFQAVAEAAIAINKKFGATIEVLAPIMIAWLPVPPPLRREPVIAFTSYRENRTYFACSHERPWLEHRLLSPLPPRRKRGRPKKQKSTTVATL